MRWLRNLRRRERGATAVFVGLSMTLLLGFGAAAIDLAGAYSDQQQLQNGADAAALAIAKSCAYGDCEDSSDYYAKANKLDGNATGTVVGSMGPASVTVESSTVRENWFGPVIGFPTTGLHARAQAKWGWPSGGATLPLTVSWCAFYSATGGWDDQGQPLSDEESIIYMIEHSCTPPAHNEVPGGFGWLQGINCSATVVAGVWVMSDPGNDGSTSCRDFDWTTLQNKTVLVPIFDDAVGTGSNAMFKVKGLAAFTITGYCFSPEAKWNVTKCPADKQLKGHFSNYVDLSGAYQIDPNATHFGVPVVKLTA
ncbi:MAG: hypothetical protein CVT62_04985 [Actinobacteria bacterium HGW-Actinobacteria-2]|nr:MAG: hypothetical protein CVT62_04985 [Actinobacteria bacterium HGW-Actinobacteria-2]